MTSLSLRNLYYLTHRIPINLEPPTPPLLEKNLPPTRLQIEKLIKCPLKELGRGSFGKVYWKKNQKKTSVIKVGSNSPKSLAKFKKENAAYDEIEYQGNCQYINRRIQFFTIDLCPFLELSSNSSACDLDEYFSLVSPTPSNIQKLAKYTLIHTFTE